MRLIWRERGAFALWLHCFPPALLASCVPVADVAVSPQPVAEPAASLSEHATALAEGFAAVSFVVVAEASEPAFAAVVVVADDCYFVVVEFVVVEVAVFEKRKKAGSWT